MNNKLPWRQQQEPAAPQPQAVNIPLINVAGYCFNPLCIVAIDMTGYKTGVEGRAISLHLAHDCGTEFADEAADQFYYWYLLITGQAKVEPV